MKLKITIAHHPRVKGNDLYVASTEYKDSYHCKAGYSPEEAEEELIKDIKLSLSSKPTIEKEIEI